MLPPLTAPALLQAYEALRPLLPAAAFPPRYAQAPDLAPLTDAYDAFFFDAFGVLNIGETAIAGAADRIVALRRAGGGPGAQVRRPGLRLCGRRNRLQP